MMTEVPVYKEVTISEGNEDFTYTGDDGEPVTISRPTLKRVTVPEKPMKVLGYVPTYSIKTTSGDTSSGGEIDYSNTFSTASPPSISSGSTTSGLNSGGGGGSKPKKADTVKKSDTVDRYKEVNDSLDNTAKAMDAASKAADRLYGNARIAQMEKVNALIKKEIELNNIKRKEALRYLAEDKKALD
jgi:hypothetical protein